jgi:putative oxidoreductase
MLGISKNDFAIRVSNFDLTKEWNILRIMCGAFLIPHIAGKFADWAPQAATVGFFEKAGFVPGAAWVYIAAGSEALAGAALVLGICTRYAALGAAAVLGIAAYALFAVKGFGWVWNKGGFEFPIFWAVTCVVIAVHEFKLVAVASDKAAFKLGDMKLGV